MSLQPYPATGPGQVTGPPDRPRSVRIAVILMYAGAALSAVSAVVTLALSGQIRSAVGTAARSVKTARPLTAAQISSLENFYVFVIVAVLVIAVALWLWMARANSHGRGWARITASVLLALNTISLVYTVGRTSGPAVFFGLGWLIGVAAVIFLWRRESSEFIARSKPGT